ncbi:plastocyanin/azurin family copper-binding protein [Spirosoma spitsbergense]|uniref:plastocyanin/azurin family copper-binding protein n=1 Tax=Spirosoma spitsbergense TaxID=431554 RepID=UPI000381DB65|nr:plastocyanin/azurin family copper-binding protein [Spirosoma spitsbergense]
MFKLLVLILSFSVAYPAFAQRDTTIIISASAGLQFDQKRLVIKPNTRLKILFQNKDDMAHNLVVTRPNSRLRVVEFALALGDKGTAQNHVPVMDDVLAHTRSVDPGTTDSLVVTLTEGAFPFVCTYPGHGYVMYGVIYATSTPKKLPPPEQDTNLPNPSRVAEAGHQHKASESGHPYSLTLPAVCRTFMPDCGPAAIAVGLPGPSGQESGQSYVFDAGQCRMRYAWSGGFVDNTEQWDGKGQRFTKVVGDIYFRDTGGFPWRVGFGTQPPPRFKGYRLVNRYPEFRYVVNGVEIRELVKSLPTGRGLVRTFTLGPGNAAITFLATAQPGIRLKPSVGKLTNGEIRLPAGTRRFTLTMEKDG